MPSPFCATSPFQLYGSSWNCALMKGHVWMTWPSCLINLLMFYWFILCWEPNHRVTDHKVGKNVSCFCCLWLDRLELGMKPKSNSHRVSWCCVTLISVHSWELGERGSGLFYSLSISLCMPDLDMFCVRSPFSVKTQFLISAVLPSWCSGFQKGGDRRMYMLSLDFLNC